MFLKWMTYTGKVAVEDSMLTGSTLASSLTAIIDGVDTDFWRGELRRALSSLVSASLLDTTFLKSF